MHSDIRRGLAMLEAASQFGRNQPIPANARAAVLFAEVGEAAAEIRNMGGSQDANRNLFLSGASECRFIASEMRRLMRQIARVAKFVPSNEYPQARYKLQVPRSNGYQALLTRAAVYLETLPAMKSAFLERGMPADFDVQLQLLIGRFQAATQKKTRGLYEQVGNTAGMKARLRGAVRAVRELDVILSLLLANDPALYAAWRSMSHIERAPRRGEKGAVGGVQAAPDAAVESANATDGTNGTNVTAASEVAPSQGQLWFDSSG